MIGVIAESGECVKVAGYVYFLLALGLALFVA